MLHIALHLELGAKVVLSVSARTERYRMQRSMVRRSSLYPLCILLVPTQGTRSQDKLTPLARPHVSLLGNELFHVDHQSEYIGNNVNSTAANITSTRVRDEDLRLVILAARIPVRLSSRSFSHLELAGCSFYPGKCCPKQVHCRG